MPRIKHTAPRPTRNTGQISLDLPEQSFLWRTLMPWTRPEWHNSKAWRNFVLRQPVAIDCRETLIAQISSLEWSVDATDPNLRDEYRSDIDYYTRFLSKNQDYDFITMVEWIARDYLDLPFGGAAEIGRVGDSPVGKVVWIELLDAGTLFPTTSREYPVGQSLSSIYSSQGVGITTTNTSPGTMVSSAGLPSETVYFPKHAINRVYMSPRTEIDRKGWGMAPPEKAYLAIELLNRGDIYYANLLLDTPEAGILDLADMDAASAQEWVKQFRNLLGGIDPLKVPVLYEHEGQARWIPFGRPPTEMMFDRVTTKYAALISSAYGISLSDIGFQGATSGGETLAGSIRQERRMKRTGFSRLKKKLHYFFNALLPEHLVFTWIDVDDELSVSIARARLANAQSFKELITMGIYTPNEMRQQLVADGLVTIPVPDKIPEEDMLQLPAPSPSKNGGVNTRDILGRKVPPSLGGHGEITNKFEAAIDRSILSLADVVEEGDIELFDSNLDYDMIVDDFMEYAPEKNRDVFRNEVKSELVKIWDTEFLPKVDNLRGHLSLGRMGYAYIADELKNMRYNIIENFGYEVLNIAKRINDNDNRN